MAEQKRFEGVVLSLDSSRESSGKPQKYSNLVPPTEVLILVAWGAALKALWITLICNQGLKACI